MGREDQLKREMLCIHPSTKLLYIQAKRWVNVGAFYYWQSDKPGVGKSKPFSPCTHRHISMMNGPQSCILDRLQQSLATLVRQKSLQVADFTSELRSRLPTGPLACLADTKAPTSNCWDHRAVMQSKLNARWRAWAKQKIIINLYGIYSGSVRRVGAPASDSREVELGVRNSAVARMSVKFAIPGKCNHTV